MSIIGVFLPLLILAGLVYGVISGFRALTGSGDRSEPLDTAEAAKSFAIHVGLFLALIGCAVGLIDLFQSFVEESDLLAGSNSDLARGLSLLIVSGPAFALLLRAIGGRYRQRVAQGDTLPHRGWSVYLVVALTTTLIASLVSVAQITERVTSDTGDFEPNELVQLLVWCGLWVAHWFWLRPRFRVRADAHLALGSIVGLSWMLAGAGAVVYRILAEGYDSAFNDSLAVEFEVALWVVIAIVGALVWVWHWVVHFNRGGSGASVEGDRRKSPLWFLTAVVAGVLPGLIAILVTATTMVSGLLIWFVGTNDKEASEYFEPAPALIAVLFIGVLTWAYHRWELERDGAPVRNESLRFHDYVVVAVGLVGVVGATAALVSLLIDALSVGEYFAGYFETDNGLIIVLTVLAASAGVWWWHWTRIERHRAAEPYEESDSIWRKLYLIAGFGIAGLVFGVALIWILFAFLRDLLDGQLGQGTLEDLTGPIGWAIAVVGAVWYHLDVWRQDRSVIAALAPPPPPPAPLPAHTAQYPPPAGPAGSRPPAPTGVQLRPAAPADYGEIFTLQRAAFVDEALAYGTVDVPSLQETYDEFSARMANSFTTVAVDEGRIIGAVSLRAYREGGPDIERLMVAPDRRRDGVAIQLLHAVEGQLRAQGHPAVQLVVGELVTAARTLYDSQGYQIVAREQAEGGPSLLTARKQLT